MVDMIRGTGYDPKNLIIDRFGLNTKDIEKYQLPWIENLKTGSGRESKDKIYITKHGRRKVESNALFRNEKTLQAGSNICRTAIEKYYGEDALERFEAKEIETRETLKEILDDPLWEDFKSKIGCLADQMRGGNEAVAHSQSPEPGNIYTIEYDPEHYPVCPLCGTAFDDSELKPERVYRCKICNAQITIKY
jgi:hypothetical protein